MHCQRETKWITSGVPRIRMTYLLTATLEYKIRQWKKNAFKILKEDHIHLNATKFDQSLNQRCEQNKYFQTSSQKNLPLQKLQEELMKQGSKIRRRNGIQKTVGPERREMT